MPILPAGVETEAGAASQVAAGTESTGTTKWEQPTQLRRALRALAASA